MLRCYVFEMDITCDVRKKKKLLDLNRTEQLNSYFNHNYIRRLNLGVDDYRD